MALSVKHISSTTLLVPRHCEEAVYYTHPTYNVKYCLHNCKRALMCHYMEIPSEYLSECYQASPYGTLSQIYQNGTGVPPNSYVLFVTYIQDNLCAGNLFAYATSCQNDPLTDRPVMGYLNMCPDMFSKRVVNPSEWINIIKHEVGHALGVSSYHYALMRDERGYPRTERDPQTNLPRHRDTNNNYLASTNTIQKIQRNWMSAVTNVPRMVNSLVTPSVLSAARKHFNCKTLDGVDLENEGSSASAGSHFEARIYGDELMVAELQKKSLITPILLAYMNDTGWYNVNFRVAEKWEYGKNLGCTFATRSCYEYMLTQKSRGQSYYPYCDRPSSVSCRSETSYGMCSIQKYAQALPIENQYFTNPRTFNDPQVGNYGGGANFMDYCPMLTIMDSFENLPVISDCRNGQNTVTMGKGMNVYMQSYGAQSICIEHSGHMTYHTYFMSHNLGESVSGSCHSYHCLGNNSISIDFAGQTVVCSNGEVVKQIDITRQSSRLTGTIKCPLVQLLCPTN
uniref:Leishmanolysin-like peptidase n=1 Tax=Trichobilharzia regenti TaxID=157069 RepID=A0AA85KEG3_TRIRE|nr:unnamed protein product [Trichobilharzia regenti]